MTEQKLKNDLEAAIKEQKTEDSEIRQLKSGTLEIEARLWNRKMRRAYKFHRAEPWKF